MVRGRRGHGRIAEAAARSAAHQRDEQLNVRADNEIAFALGVGLSTVETLVSAVVRRVRVTSRTELLAGALS